MIGATDSHEILTTIVKTDADIITPEKKNCFKI